MVAVASVDFPSQAGTDGLKGILLYLMVYTFMNLGAFAVITSLRQRDVIGDEIDDIAGLYYRAPAEAVLMLIFLLSLAGIPPLAGFYGKYFIFLSLIESEHYVLASLAVLYALFGLYYYMKIANAMFMREATDKTRLADQSCHVGGLERDLVRDGFYRDSAGVFHPRGELVAGHRPSRSLGLRRNYPKTRELSPDQEFAHPLGTQIALIPRQSVGSVAP